MVATLCLLGCVLATGQKDRPVSPPAAPSALRGDWILIPRLSRGQELVYRGTFAEEAGTGRVQFSQSYRVETRVFVLDTPPRGASVAFLTVLKHHDPLPPGPSRPEPASSSVRLERAEVDLQGKILPAPGVSLAVPLDGPPTVECGAIVEVPRGRVGPGSSWDVLEAGRPPQTWRAVATEMVTGTSCLKLVAEQKSDDWDRPRADRTAWHRRDTVWVAPRLGVACRVERVIERREPARRDPTERSVFRYELESSLQYPGRLGEDRAQEILRAEAFRASAAPFLATPARYTSQLTALLNKINYHLERQPPTPYREAVLQVQRRVEAARRGETPPALPAETPTAPAVATVGALAPDFMVSDFGGPEPVRLRRWLGRPLLLVFYHPDSPTAAEVLRYAQHLHTAQPGLTVLGLSVSDDAALVRRQRTALGLTFPVLSGSGLRVSYAVETTPKLVVLDAAGVVRGAYLGWGRDTSQEVQEEVRRWLTQR
jgi:peroxiredoxin